jgi:CubicO group peptidase (beta-lactamase class C family)
MTLMLVDAGKIALDDPISKYIPSFADIKVGLERIDAHGETMLELVPAKRQVSRRKMSAAASASRSRSWFTMPL